MDAQAIGRRLSELRKESNKTQKEVADAIGVSVSTVAMYETGERIPRDIYKVRLAKLYRKSVTSLFFADKVH